MGTPRAFRFMAKAMTRSPLADTDPVPFAPRGLPLVTARPDGRPLRAIVAKRIVEVEVADRRDFVEQRVVTYSLADLPRMPARGDHIHVDGEVLSVAVVTATRVGLVDCVMAD
ncbi:MULTISPECIES: hypothetical protein [unclassified Methylobacterium]|uniref:head-tail joining protein n=1 Tax=unclassified Methylobacterium TaxID=2615210 RepID=UPI000CB0167C|nr:MULTISPECIES: hypothetical protein [unclassified Methylobacterium]PIU06631.1 MAG: hypothetical protein COT56_08860 [Methylobacterium sp. CG09_land_8_20_14_0_10_71_15]PIU11331.1 MAG: hypothetical protein COT28_20565 [Methylobacterium sp. CG08_land_8_20_14_0_20_71_15]GBU19011.1 hypothetical protein AwMethylo_32260 [Methylobacterium sp.]